MGELSRNIRWIDRMCKGKVGIVIIVAKESIFQSSNVIIQEKVRDLQIVYIAH